MEHKGIETERKFLIRMPEKDWLEGETESSDIVQTYLINTEKGMSRRVRQRSGNNGTVYTHTEKRHISAMSREEYEREISREEYEKLLSQADPGRRRIEKRRHVLRYRGQCFEIDVFGFWNDRAIMEIELESESKSVDFPPQIEILKEVTEDGRYTNSAMAREIPMDEID